MGVSRSKNAFFFPEVSQFPKSLEEAKSLLVLEVQLPDGKKKGDSEVVDRIISFQNHSLF